MASKETKHDAFQYAITLTKEFASSGAAQKADSIAICLEHTYNKLIVLIEDSQKTD